LVYREARPPGGGQIRLSAARTPRIVPRRNGVLFTNLAVGDAPHPEFSAAAVVEHFARRIDGLVLGVAHHTALSAKLV